VPLGRAGGDLPQGSLRLPNIDCSSVPRYKGGFVDSPRGEGAGQALQWSGQGKKGGRQKTGPRRRWGLLGRQRFQGLRTLKGLITLEVHAEVSVGLSLLASNMAGGGGRKTYRKNGDSQGGSYLFVRGEIL